MLAIEGYVFAWSRKTLGGARLDFNKNVGERKVFFG